MYRIVIETINTKNTIGRDFVVKRFEDKLLEIVVSTKKFEEISKVITNEPKASPVQKRRRWPSY